MITCTFEDGYGVHLRHVVTDVLAVKEGKILLVKRASHLSEGGKWALPGGFLDFDESTEQGAAREVYEETGWEVAGLQLLKINDGQRVGENRQNVSFVYICKAAKKTGKPDNESTEQRWFSFDSLPPNEEIAFDHADNIAMYVQTIGDASE